MSKFPIRMRASLQNDPDHTALIKVLLNHPMLTGLSKDEQGRPRPAHFITEVSAEHNGRQVLAAQFGTAVSKNPYLAFKFKGGAKGDKLAVSWVDNKGDKRTDEVQIA